jgi:hypothetical protein
MGDQLALEGLDLHRQFGQHAYQRGHGVPERQLDRRQRSKVFGAQGGPGSARP